MPNVPPTKLTTTDPGHGDLSLCDGFALVPYLGAFRARTALDDSGGTLFEGTLNLEVFRLGMSVTHTAFTGICGPSYAIDVDTDAGTNYEVPLPGQPASGTLVVDDHAVRGGFQAGIDFNFAIDFDLSLNLVFTKKKLISLDEDIDIDVIELVYTLLKKLLDEGGGGQAKGNPNEFELATFKDANTDAPSVDEGSPSGNTPGGAGGHGPRPEFTASGMVDYIPKPFLPQPNQTFDKPPEVTLEPSLAWGFSLVPLFADIPFLDILYGLDKALETFYGGFEFGPGIAIGLPTTVRLKGATISNHPFDIDSAQASGVGPDATSSFGLAERTPIDPSLQPLTDDPEEIGVLLEHELGFSVGVYFFAEFTFFKVAHIGMQTGTWNPFGAVKVGGPYENQLSFIPGGGAVPFDEPQSAPAVGPYTANQPQGDNWREGAVARYGVSFFNASYESPIGPVSAYDPSKRFFAYPELSSIPVNPPPLSGPQPVTGRGIYRQFKQADGNEGPIERIAEIPDNTTTTFTDTVP